MKADCHSVRQSTIKPSEGRYISADTAQKTSFWPIVLPEIEKLFRKVWLPLFVESIEGSTIPKGQARNKHAVQAASHIHHFDEEGRNISD
jgi:hypothetical protein